MAESPKRAWTPGAPAPPPTGARGAQRRADRIRAFEEELRRAEADGAIALTREQRERLRDYHGAVLAGLASEFDVDVAPDQKRYSRGAQAAGLVGALAIGIALVLAVQRWWDALPFAGQVAVLMAAGAAPLAGVAALRDRAAMRAFLPIAGLVAFCGFLLDAAGLLWLFAIPWTPHVVLALALFAGALAYACNSRVLLVGSAAIACVFVGGVLLSIGGAWWDAWDRRPESLIASGAAIAMWSRVPHPRRDAFPPVLRLLAVAAIGGGVLLCSRMGAFSFISADPDAVAAAYQVIAFVVGAAAAAIGIRRGWSEVTLGGALVFGIALFLKYVDWWWRWLPGWLFFLVIGVSALALVWVLRALRRWVPDADAP